MTAYYSTNDGGYLFRLAKDESPTRYSGPYAVINPTDREQVERLRKVLSDSGAFTGLTKGSVAKIAAALREFANPKPPKPEEPTGLGAVVEDDKGHKFVRIADPIDGWMKDRDWRRIGGDINADPHYGWSRIAAVRVLSEGVQP